MSQLRLTEIEAKSGMEINSLPEPFMVSLYRSLAPYRGCGHACQYCDGRAEKYFVEGCFDRDIAVRRNVAERAAADIRSGKTALEYGALCFSSGVTDVYQASEAGLGLTRQLLAALQPSGLPIVILTKSALVRCDFDLLASFPRVLLIMTITTLDETLASWLEPGASSPRERLETLRAARQAGFMAGVMAMPLCPGLSDSLEQAGDLFSAAKEAGAQFVCPGGLTLRPGRQKQLFVDTLRVRQPELLPVYKELYAENRPSGMPRSGTSRSAMAQWQGQLAGLALPSLIPWSVYSELLSPADSLFVLLCHLQDLYAQRKVDIRPLKAARERYADWLKATRCRLRRSLRATGRPEPDLFFAKAASDSSANFPLSAELSRLLERELETVLGNDRLAALCRPLLEGRAIFDYVALRLQEHKPCP